MEANVQESKKDWMLWMMAKAVTEKSNVKNRQFWQQDIKPVELWSRQVMDQKIDYVHMNPVVSGCVNEPENWKDSSALKEVFPEFILAGAKSWAWTKKYSSTQNLIEETLSGCHHFLMNLVRMDCPRPLISNA